jgi:tetratricopeptide (TPR) repeat protein
VRRPCTVLTALGLVWSAAIQPCFAQAPARMLVMPFESSRRDGAIFWLGEGAAVLLADDLNALGGGAITREERLQAFERLQVPPAAALTDATVIRIGQLVGAADMVVGSLQLDNADSADSAGGATLIVHARRITLEAGRVQADVIERGPLADLFAIFERVARRVDGSPLPTAPPGNLGPPVAAFENYVKGLLAETPATALGYLNTALRIYPAYDRARLALWDVYAQQDQHDKALLAVAAVPAGSAMMRRAQFLTGLSQIELKQYDAAFATYTALADARATPAVLNNLGVVQLRRSATPQTGLPTYYFNKAADADPEDPDYAFNLGYAYWEMRDPQASIFWLREAVRRNPADGEAHFVLGSALAATGSATESAREKELARRLSSTFEQWEKRPGTDPVPKGLERVKSDVELPHDSRVEARIAASGQRDQAELAQFYLDRARRLYEQEHDREAVTELDRALYLSPYLAEAHLLLGRIHMRNGRIREATDALKIAVWSGETSDAVTAAEAQRLLDMLKSPAN